MFHGMNSFSTCATNARASSGVRGLRPASVRNALAVMFASLSRQRALWCATTAGEKTGIGKRVAFRAACLGGSRRTTKKPLKSVVDMHERSKAGDVVCAELKRERAERGEIVFRLFEPPYLIAVDGTSPRRPIAVDEELAIIRGVVTSSHRSRRTT